MSQVSSTKITDLPSSNSWGSQEKPQFSNIPSQFMNSSPSQTQVMQPMQKAQTMPNLPSQAQQTSSQGIPPQQINQIIQSVQDTTTTLPSRDIPMQNQKVTLDETVKPNYVPNQSTKKYIDSEDDDDENYDVDNDDEKAEQKTKRFENIIQKLKEPFVISLLYFMFQLSIIDNTLFRYIPRLFVKEGELSFYGVMVKCLLFGAIYTGIQFAIKYGASLR